MYSVINDCCQELQERLHDVTPRETLLKQCAQKKLMNLYNKENSEFDELLHKLEVYVDYDSPKEVKSCVVKLLRLLSKNRKILFRTIKELC